MPSSVVATMHYNAGTSILTVVFTSGAVYEYVDVPEAVYNEMRSSGSKGSFLNEVIKKQYAFKKVA